MRTTLRSLLTATLLLAPVALSAQPAQWKKQAARVTIIRDQWGIAHVYGKSDADAITLSTVKSVRPLSTPMA